MDWALVPFSEPTDIELDGQLATIRAQHPKAAATRTPWGIPGYSEHEAAAINRRLEKFYGDYREYLENLRNYDSIDSRKILIQLLLTNSGKGPATDIDINIQFSQPIAVIKEADYPMRPEPPKLPENNIFSGFRVNAPDIIPLHEHLAALREQNITSTINRHGGEFSVAIRVKKLKHGNTEQLPPFFIIPVERKVGSIGLKSRITCNELSEGTERDLAESVTLGGISAGY
jgi:hypothetical protein